MIHVNYGLFFDNHTHPDNPDVGKNFNADQFTDQLLDCGVDYLGFHARCNAGMAYYNTRIGIRHPALTYDLFGQLADACQRKNITLVAYLNGGISNQEAIEHRDWATLPPQGTGKWHQVTPYSTTMCYNSPYRKHLIDMIREIAMNYPVKGFFIDCLGMHPCVCPTCVRRMKQQNMDYEDLQQITEFARLSALDMCADIRKAVTDIIPEPMLYFNGPVFGTAKDLDTYFDCECLPTCGEWGYDYLPTMTHYVRNIKPGRLMLNMTGRFYDWGDFGGLRSADSLKFDLFYGLAQGLRPNVSSHLHPRGDRDQAVFDRIREVYQDLRPYDPWYHDAVNLSDVAIVWSHDRLPQQRMPSVNSAVRMLEELKVQFDIVLADCDKSWEHYKLLILPEGIEITDLLKARIRQHIARGGAFFACGKLAAQAFPDELGIRYQGDCGLNPVYLQMNGEFCQDVADMFLSLYAPATKALMTTARGASRLVKPYCNIGWQGEYAHYYTPPQEATDMPFLTVHGKCVWCAGDIFTGYATRGALHLRQIVSNVIESLVREPLIVVHSLPSFVRLLVTEQPQRLNLHLLAYAPEKRLQVTMVEDARAFLHGAFQVYTGDCTVTRAYLAPNGPDVEFSQTGNYTRINLPPIEGYALISLDLT